MLRWRPGDGRPTARAKGTTIPRMIEANVPYGILNHYGVASCQKIIWQRFYKDFNYEIIFKNIKNIKRWGGTFYPLDPFGFSFKEEKIFSRFVTKIEIS